MPLPPNLADCLIAGYDDYSGTVRDENFNNATDDTPPANPDTLVILLF